jgi:exonuclease SbcD
VQGSVAELAALRDTVGDDLLRVRVREHARAGLREEVTELLPNALEVRIDPEFAVPVAGSRPSGGPGADRSPGELFGEYLGTRAVHDRRVEELFARLHDRVSAGSGERPEGQRPADERPADERPADERPAGGRPAGGSKENA